MSVEGQPPVKEDDEEEEEEEDTDYPDKGVGDDVPY